MKQEAAIVSGKVVLLLGGHEVHADHKYCRESGPDYLCKKQKGAEEEEAKGSGV